MRLAGGAYYERIFAVAGYGGEGFVAVGTTSDSSGWDLGLQLAGGRTLHGLQTQKVRVGWSFEWVLHRARLGLGPTIGYLSVDRVTLAPYSSPRERAQPMEQLSLGGEAHVSFDLVKVADTSAVFVCASVKADGPVWGTVLTIGYRLEAANRVLR